MSTTPSDSSNARREAMEVAEAARESAMTRPSLTADLFLGRFRPELVVPFPEQDEADRRRGDEIRSKVEAFLRENLDADEVDRTGEVPPRVIEGLRQLGCFGLKIPREYGGLGLSQVNYNRIIASVASHCGSTAVWLSAHQSIGVPQPLKLFGTEEQKKKYLPRLAKGEISAFALTEPNVGSDPARMEMTATPTEDGKAYVPNGEKLWCTNGNVAEILIVMARTPSKMVDGREKKQVTAFIVESKTPGFEIVHRCSFMGLHGIQNGLLRFKNVRVPAENILWGPGLGLKLALITLNTGRLTVPSATAGVAKQCLWIARQWAAERQQWGAPVGKHEAVAMKLAWMASHTFAMEALAEYTARLVERPDADIRLEAAVAKLFNTETGIRIADHTVQIRGGRGYESAPSLRARGEKPWPVERIYRDSRINTIIEGTSEIMHLFIAREALDPHLRRAGDLFNPKLSGGKKAKLLAKAAGFYAGWYPKQFLPLPVSIPSGMPGPLVPHLRFIGAASRRLARTIFGLMMKHGPKLEHRQGLLGRCVDVGVDLTVMAATCAYAMSLGAPKAGEASPVDLADHFCREARRRIAEAFRGIKTNDDRLAGKIAGDALEGHYAWLEKGILLAECEAATPAPSPSPRRERSGPQTLSPVS
ncbi:MAG: acyl-CoA dehydrogenase family protein [Planctomycetes bacterium]|nr:acyl-CoA dehydrogenase family protein [Planctomycetota bacterium]